METGAGEICRAKTVVLIGAESTGKTTLAAQLAGHFGTVWHPEYLRTFVDEKGALPVAEDVTAIVEGHLAGVEALAPRARRVLILDTDLVSTCIYQRYYFGTCPPEVEAAAARHYADLYLLTGTDLPWTPDPGQRDGPAVRAALHALFRAELLRRNLPHLLIGGNESTRLHLAVQAVAALLSR